jgi:hypothetical protein
MDADFEVKPPLWSCYYRNLLLKVKSSLSMKILTLTFTKVKSQNRCTLMYTYKHSEVTYRIHSFM